MSKRHGESAGAGRLASPEYQAWLGMKKRCFNRKCRDFKRYGGRGIVVCAEWIDSFEAFLAHVGRRPGPGWTLEREDNNKGYEPSNVRWATRLEQSQNTRSVVSLTFGGETMCISEWARRMGFSQSALSRRLNVLGWSVERALGTPPRADQRRK